MSELHLPSDYERLRPFRRLVAALQEKRFHHLERDPGPPTAADRVVCEMAASFLWNRLWCELALLARSTNRPGWLPSEDRHTYEETVASIFGDDSSPVELLVQCGLLVALADGWTCELFAELNPHTAGNFQTKEERGAHHSALVRNRQRISHEAHEQIRLLPEEVFVKADNQRMTEAEAQRAMNCIKTIDNCLRLAKPRLKAEYTQGLMLDAFNVVNTYQEEQLTEVYLYLRASRESAFAPKSAEAVLADFEKYLKLAQSNN